MEKYQEILEFWFGKKNEESYGKQRKEWFVKNKEFDEKVRQLFLLDYQAAAAGKLNHWREFAPSCLALIIILDQFPRNMFRDTPQAFATDNYALEIAKDAVKKGFDKQLIAVERWFIYLPFEHSENLADQQQAVKLFSTLTDDPQSKDTIEYAYRHLKVIEKFGRFPHRNQILGRKSTAEELEFLQQPGSKF